MEVLSMCLDEPDGMLFDSRKSFVSVDEDAPDSVVFEPTSLFK